MCVCVCVCLCVSITVYLWYASTLYDDGLSSALVGFFSVHRLPPLCPPSQRFCLLSLTQRLNRSLALCLVNSTSASVSYPSCLCKNAGSGIEFAQRLQSMLSHWSLNPSLPGKPSSGCFLKIYTYLKCLYIFSLYMHLCLNFRTVLYPISEQLLLTGKAIFDFARNISVLYVTLPDSHQFCLCQFINWSWS